MSNVATRGTHRVRAGSCAVEPSLALAPRSGARNNDRHPAIKWYVARIRKGG